MNNFTQILENLWWKLDQSLDQDAITACVEVAVQECIQNGVTYIFDHHSSPGSIKGSLSNISDVLRRNQIRGVLCYETSDRNQQTGIDQALQENHDFINSASCGDIKGMMGLHACFTLSDETLLRIQKLVHELSVPIHIHLAEDRADVDQCKKLFGLSPVKRLIKYDLLNHPAHLVHGVHLNEEDYEIIAKVRAAIITNPDSNMNNAVGLPAYSSIPREIPVLIGTDGMHANMHRSLKQLFLLYRMQNNSFEESFDWLQKILCNQMDNIRYWFPDFPSLHEGDRADFVLWDYIPVMPFNQDNYLGHLIYGFTESRAHTVAQNGNILMREFRLTNEQNYDSYQFLIQQGKKLYDSMEGL